jgi:hypothetical protein
MIKTAKQAKAIFEKHGPAVADLIFHPKAMPRK